ncbi:MAG: hypothetical protein ACO1O3_06710, partial [Sphingobium sp.]
QRPEQVQDETTASLAASVQTAQFALAGRAFAEAQSRWESHMTSQVLETVRANPGKRVMVIGSYRNRAMLERAVQDAAPLRAVGASNWFGRTSKENLNQGR